MAIFNEILAPRYARFMQKLFSMKGQVPLKQLAGELGAFIQIFSGAENRYLEAWSEFGNAATQAGAAASSAAFQLRNPASSNVVAVVFKLNVSAVNVGASSSQVRIGPRAADFTTIVATPTSRFDPRGVQAPTLILSSQSNIVAGLSPIMAGSSVLNNTYDYINYENQEIPILPGDALQILENTQNQALSVGIAWRERSLEESERT